MKYFLQLFFLMLPAWLSAQSWVDVAVVDGREIYVDTINISRVGTETTVWFKEVYVNDKGKDEYLARLEKAVSSKIWEKKWKKKWANVSYTVSKRVYDCINNCFRTLEITDYDNNNKKIRTLKTNEKNARWKSISRESVGDYTLYYVCDTLNKEQ